MFLLKIWPLVLYVFIWFLNVDWVVVPFIHLRFPDITVWEAYLIVVLLAEGELLFIYWFFANWLKKRIGDFQKAQDLKRELDKEGFWDILFINKALRIYHNAVDPENVIGRLVDRWGLAFVWVVAVFVPSGAPIPARSGCTSFFALFGKRRYFIHLLLANVIHLLVIVRIWAWVFRS